MCHLHQVVDCTPPFRELNTEVTCYIRRAGTDGSRWDGAPRASFFSLWACRADWESVVKVWVSSLSLRCDSKKATALDRSNRCQVARSRTAFNLCDSVPQTMPVSFRSLGWFFSAASTGLFQTEKRRGKRVENILDEEAVSSSSPMFSKLIFHLWKTRMRERECRSSRGRYVNYTILPPPLGAGPRSRHRLGVCQVSGHDGELHTDPSGLSNLCHNSAWGHCLVNGLKW